MHHPSEPISHRFHRFDVACPWHGKHVVVIFGFDHMADDAAFILAKALRRAPCDFDYTPTVKEPVVGSDGWVKAELDLDDLPF